MIIIHLIYVAMLISVYYLPLVTIQYNMHTILPEHAYVGAPTRQRPKQPIQIQSTQLSLEVMIYGVCGRQSSKTLLKIHENMEILRNAGNLPTNNDYDKGIQEVAYDNRLQSLLEMKLVRKVNEVICNFVNNDNEQGSTSFQPSFDRQYATWVAAGLVVMMILLFAGAPLSIFCIVTICTLNWIEWRYNKHRRSTRSKSRWWLLIELLSNVNAGVVLFATFLYVALTWQECQSSKASYGSGYMIMLLASIFMSIRLSGFSIDEMLLLAATRCRRKVFNHEGKVMCIGK
jgi:hypothetical protein